MRTGSGGGGVRAGSGGGRSSSTRLTVNSPTNSTQVPGNSPSLPVVSFLPDIHLVGSGHAPEADLPTSSTSPSRMLTSELSRASKGKLARYLRKVVMIVEHRRSFGSSRPARRIHDFQNARAPAVKGCNGSSAPLCPSPLLDLRRHFQIT